VPQEHSTTVKPRRLVGSAPGEKVASSSMTTASVTAKVATAVPPPGCPRAVQDVALGAFPGAHRALGDGPGSGGMDGRRRRRRGTPSNPEKNRYVFTLAPPTPRTVVSEKKRGRHALRVRRRFSFDEHESSEIMAFEGLRVALSGAVKEFALQRSKNYGRNSNRGLPPWR
jgi:hypothetical protein